jgi:hypothetical protein
MELMDRYGKMFHPDTIVAKLLVGRLLRAAQEFRRLDQRIHEIS